MHIDRMLQQIQNDRLRIEQDLAVGNRLRARRRMNLVLSLILNHLRKPEPELSAWFRIVANLALVDKPLSAATQLDFWPQVSSGAAVRRSSRGAGSGGRRQALIVGGEFITQDRAVIDRLLVLEKLASTNLPILLEGESGTGKEVLSRAVHNGSQRAGAPLVAVNCGAIPLHLQESELFGHARGAYTGATMEKPGLFEAASGGTLFLDEIGEMDPQAQVKLLRVLESGEIRRLGEVKVRQVDVRIVAATNTDVDQAVAEKRFRSDLLYRIGAVRFQIPPLRDRTGDIVPLATHFIHRASTLSPLLTPAALTALTSHQWPGNVRELKHTIDRVLALWDPDRGGAITSEMLFPGNGSRLRKTSMGPLPDKIPEAHSSISPDTSPAVLSAIPSATLPPGENLDLFLTEIEREIVAAALERSGGNRTQAARLLGGISRTTLISKMKRLGLFVKREVNERTRR